MATSSRHSGRSVVATAVLLLMIAHGVSFGQTDRETWQPPAQIMDAIGVEPGMRVGEVGAGKGYFTFPLSRRVGPEGIVFANDISTSSLDVIRDRAENEALDNIKIVVGEVVDPLFPEDDLDMIVMVYVLHMLEKPVEFLQHVGKYLGPGAPLVIIEALAARTPLLVSDAGGMAELVAEGRNGLHFRLGDADDLAQKLAGLLADPARLGALRQGAEVRTVADVALEVEAVYREGL